MLTGLVQRADWLVKHVDRPSGTTCRLTVMTSRKAACSNDAHHQLWVLDKLPLIQFLHARERIGYNTTISRACT